MFPYIRADIDICIDLLYNELVWLICMFGSAWE
jgi:hypothetical protein